MTLWSGFIEKDLENIRKYPTPEDRELLPDCYNATCLFLQDMYKGGLPEPNFLTALYYGNGINVMWRTPRKTIFSVIVQKKDNRCMVHETKEVFDLHSPALLNRIRENVLK